MSQAEELLNGMSEEVPVHAHPVPDTDTYFVIDPVTRKIENTNPKKHVIMQYDHNSERCTFELPRYVDGHDMLECTSVTANVDNIEVVESDGVEEVEPRVNSDAPDMTDLRVHPTDPEKVISSWLISRNSTQLAGILSFHIEYKCVDSNGNVVYEWSTDNYDEYEVRARKKNGEAVVTPHIDTLEQWRTRIFGAGDSVMANIAAEGEAQVAAVKAESETQQEAVELKGAQTLDTIPEDYTEVDAMAEEAVRSKGDAIVCEVSGESVILKDSSNDHIRGLNLFGKSSQVTTTGAQLLPQPYHESSKESSGVKFTVNDDGSITISGTSSATELASCYFTMNAGLNLSGTYTYKCYGLPDNCVTNIYYIGDVTGESEKTMNLVEENSYGFVICVRPNANVSATVYPMLVAGDTIKPYEPYTAGSVSPNPDYPQDITSITDPEVNLYGKQLLNVYTKTSNSIDLKVNDDVCEMTNLTTNRYGNVVFKFSLAPGVYTLAADSFEGHIIDSGYLIKLSDEDTNVYITSLSTANLSRTFSIEKNTNLKIELYAGGVTVGEKHIIRGLGVYYGEGNYSWTPYVKAQSIALTHTLAGIPVTSGGNYTDSDGQQWICDEVDFERGAHIQRIAQYVYDGSEDENWKNGYSSNGINNRFELILRGVPIEHEVCESNNAAFVAKNAYCSHFNYQRTSTRPDVNNFRISKTVAAVQDWWYMLFVPDTTIIPLEDLDAWKTYLAENPITVMVPLNTPIETPLSAEEITAFKALRTNYPNTTILNDAGAWMSVKYNADTKSYVDKPKTLRLTDTSTGVVYELKVVDGNLTVVPIQ